MRNTNQLQDEYRVLNEENLALIQQFNLLLDKLQTNSIDDKVNALNTAI